MIMKLDFIRFTFFNANKITNQIKTMLKAGDKPIFNIQKLW